MRTQDAGLRLADHVRALTKAFLSPERWHYNGAVSPDANLSSLQV